MHDLILSQSQPDGSALLRLIFDRAVPGHVAPGQFVTVHVEGHKAGYFALASGPGQLTELLIKPQGPVAEHLAALPVGSVVRVSDPIGKGFGVEADGRPLVVLVNGSGISAVRGLIDAEIAAGLPRPVHLLYGVLTPGHAAFQERLAAWRAAGVAVHLVLDAPQDGWDGPTGFVQHHAQRLGLVTDAVSVALVGFPAMIEETKALYAAAGLAPERVRTNF